MTTKLLIDRRSKNIAAAMGGIILLLSFASLISGPNYQGLNPIFKAAQTPPLVMSGGDPYLRAPIRCYMEAVMLKISVAIPNNVFGLSMAQI
jgi:hypothetical protein